MVDIKLMERFGWTLAELDEADEARLMPALAAVNMNDAARRNRAWLDAASRPGARAGLGNPEDARADMLLQEAKQQQARQG